MDALVGVRFDAGKGNDAPIGCVADEPECGVDLPVSVTANNSMPYGSHSSSRALFYPVSVSYVADGAFFPWYS